MRAHKVDVGLGDGAHTDLIERSRQERCECAHKDDRAVTSRSSDRHANEVLFRDVALDEAIGEGVLVDR